MLGPPEFSDGGNGEGVSQGVRCGSLVRPADAAWSERHRQTISASLSGRCKAIFCALQHVLDPASYPMNSTEQRFLALLAKHARRPSVSMNDIIFRGGLDMSSIRFTEFILDLEDTLAIEIDVESLDASIKTVGQLFQRVAGYPKAS